MAKIVQLPLQKGRFDLKPVKKSRIRDEDPAGQLKIFPVEDSANEDGKVISISRNANSFEQALLAHDEFPEQAVELYKRAIDNGDHLPDAYCNLGILESQGGLASDAINSFTKALEQEPRHYEAHYNLANIFADAGNLKLARIHYEIARDIDSGDPALHFNLAIVLASEELFAPALDSLQQYFELLRGEPDKQAKVLMALLENSINKKQSK